MIRLMTDPHSTTFRAALYARVSTEDRQAPEDSIAWQRSVASALIEASGGRIVVEYLDVSVSRALPWSRRPEAARLLSDCGRRDRDSGRSTYLHARSDILKLVTAQAAVTLLGSLLGWLSIQASVMLAAIPFTAIRGCYREHGRPQL